MRVGGVLGYVRSGDDFDPLLTDTVSMFDLASDTPLSWE